MTKELKDTKETGGTSAGGVEGERTAQLRAEIERLRASEPKISRAAQLCANRDDLAPGIREAHELLLDVLVIFEIQSIKR